MNEVCNSVNAIQLCECDNCEYNSTLQIFVDAITECNEDTFFNYLPYIKSCNKKELVASIVEYGTMSMLKSIHEGKAYGPYYYAIFDPICIAVKVNEYEMLEWMLEYGYKTIHISSLYTHMIFEDVEMLRVLHKYKLYGNMPDMIRYIFRYLIETKSYKIHPISSENYSNETLEYLLYIHDNFPRSPKDHYNFDCVNGISCHLCRMSNERKMTVVADSWILDRYEYDSSIQWLPREMIEDVFLLLS